jgi:hypothetical protein
LIKTGIIGGLLLVTVRIVYGPFREEAHFLENGDDYIFLTAEDAMVVASIAPVILNGALPEEGSEYDIAIMEIVKGVDKTVTGLTPSVQGEVRDLFDLLTFPLTRRWLACVSRPWHDARQDEIVKFLRWWQKSRFNLLRGAYKALHEIITASWYGNERSWSVTGYPGPPDIGV